MSETGDRGNILQTFKYFFLIYIRNQKGFGFLKNNTGSKTNNEAVPLKL